MHTDKSKNLSIQNKQKKDKNYLDKTEDFYRAEYFAI